MFILPKFIGKNLHFKLLGINSKLRVFAFKSAEKHEIKSAVLDLSVFISDTFIHIPIYGRGGGLTKN